MLDSGVTFSLAFNQGWKTGALEHVRPYKPHPPTPSPPFLRFRFSHTKKISRTYMYTMCARVLVRLYACVRARAQMNHCTAYLWMFSIAAVASTFCTASEVSVWMRRGLSITRDTGSRTAHSRTGGTRCRSRLDRRGCGRMCLGMGGYFYRYFREWTLCTVGMFVAWYDFLFYPSPASPTTDANVIVRLL